MVRTGRAIDRVRRRVDDAMIFASLLLLAWPALFADVVRQHRGALAYAVPVGIVAVTGSALVALNRRSRWPLAAVRPGRVRGSDDGLLALPRRRRRAGADLADHRSWRRSSLVRQFLGARTNEDLLREMSRQRAILARQAFRDPLTELGNRKMFLDHATTRWPTPTTR